MSESSFQGALVWQNIAIERDQKTILTNISGKLEQGQSLLVTGPNGIGKTSFLRSFAGLLPPLAGGLHLEIYRSGVQNKYTSLSEEYGFYIGYLGHQNALKPDLCLKEDLRFWAQIYNMKHAETCIQTVLEAVHLAHVRNMMCRHLSSGQKRRLAIARLFLTQRPIWILDEPFVGLDQVSRESLENLFAAHQEKGGMIITASHDPISLNASQFLDLSVFQAQKKTKMTLEREWLTF